MSSIKSADKKQYNVHITSIINMLFILGTKLQQFTIQCLTNTINCLSIIYSSMFYLISIIMDIGMKKEENKTNDEHCSCSENRQNIFQEKEFQYYYGKMITQLSRIEQADPTKIQPLRIEDTEDPASAPKFWISKIYKDKSIHNECIAYKLCDGSICLVLWDATRLLLSHPNEISLRYIDSSYNETFLTFNSYPKELEKKVDLMKQFAELMNDPISKSLKTQNKVSDLPYVVTRFDFGIAQCRIFYLSNHTMQISIIGCVTMILCPKNGSITFRHTLNKKSSTTYKLDLIERYGCSRYVFGYLKILYGYICCLFLSGN